MGDELVGLFERAFVEQQQDAFAGGELALAMLAFAALCASAFFGEGVAAVEFEGGIGERGRIGSGIEMDYRQAREEDFCTLSLTT